MSEKYPNFLYARIVNPGTEDQFLLTGPEHSDVADDVVGEQESVAETVGRYVLAGIGKIHHTAPVYVEEIST